MALFTNTGWANIYRQASFHSEIDTQTILWEHLVELERNGDFIRVQTEDSYEGWINRHQVSESDAADTPTYAIVTKASAKLHEAPDNISPAVRAVVAGCRLPLISEQEHWLKVVLPDGCHAWLEGSALAPMPARSREHIIAYARSLLGVPYFWGGKTPHGLDCSGLVQHVFKMFGLSLRRDARLQFEDCRPVSDDCLAGAQGDLMFFSEDGSRISHVGFCLGQGRLLHARGMVRINSLIAGEADYSEQLKNHFVEIKTCLD